MAKSWPQCQPPLWGVSTALSRTGGRPLSRMVFSQRSSRSPGKRAMIIISSPTRTAADLSALAESHPDRRVILIAGGFDKHIPYGPLADALFAPGNNVRALVLTGDTAKAIREAVEAHPAYPDAIARGFRMTENPDFDAAVREAAAAAKPGDTVLLSPASPAPNSAWSFCTGQDLCLVPHALLGRWPPQREALSPWLMACPGWMPYGA